MYLNILSMHDTLANILATVHLSNCGPNYKIGEKCTASGRPRYSEQKDIISQFTHLILRYKRFIGHRL